MNRSRRVRNQEDPVSQANPKSQKSHPRKDRDHRQKKNRKVDHQDKVVET